MDKRALQSYAVWAQENLEKQIRISLNTLGILSEKEIRRAKRIGDFTVIDGDAASYPYDMLTKRNAIVEMVKTNGYQSVVEELAYTWFNRIIALRFMEVHDFLDHGFRVLSNRSGGVEPEILQNLDLVQDALGLDLAYCADLKDKIQTEELFRYVLLKQCAALSDILPMLFQKDNDYLELLLPKNLLRGDTVITRLREIPEEAFLEDVEIIGWLYQFYNSAKKDAVFASKKTITKDTLPAVTQLFTPDWIVRYMAENSVGRIWLESYPDSPLRSEMKYYVEDAEQTEEVQRKLDAIKYRNVNPEEIRIIEPCCGSGHILVYVFDLLYKMYEEKGYNKRDIPSLILKNNLTGLDVDKRAAQLASFSLIMKARSCNNRFFREQYYVLPNVHDVLDSKSLRASGFLHHLKELKLLTDSELEEIKYLIDIFENGKTIGSLLKVRKQNYAAIEAALTKIEQKAVLTIFNSDIIGKGIKEIRELIVVAKSISAKYDVMITNPPYIGTSTMEDSVKEYAVRNYPNSKSDMFAMFMETGFVKSNGFMAMINMHVWMFITTYEKFRISILATKNIVTMIHLGSRAFDSIPGEVVQTVSFVMRNIRIFSYIGTFHRLVEGENEKNKELLFHNSKPFYKDADSFGRISGSPIDYWINKNIVAAFSGKNLGQISEPRMGLTTGQNDKYLRLWFEVKSIDIGFAKDRGTAQLSHLKWFPYDKAGEFRKWYGNRDYVVNWYNDGYEMQTTMHPDGNRIWAHNFNLEYNFKPHISWNDITPGTISFRYFEKGFLFDAAAAVVFIPEELQFEVLGYLNSNFVNSLTKLLNPTIHFKLGDFSKLPYQKWNVPIVSDISKENISLCRLDWDSFETSWDFLEHPLARWSKGLWDATSIGCTMEQYYGGHPKVSCPLELCFMLWQGECKERFAQLKANEEELNRIFIDIYGLQDELTPEVEDKDVTVQLADRERDIRSLISYLVGVIMGRYSPDVPGLAYAGGNWDASKFRSYQPDDDGIVPIYAKVGMEDGLTARIAELVKRIFGKGSYRENMEYIAEALGRGNNESPEETLNRYLNDGFYQDHLKIYQKRPIYWMFSSGKNSGFKCLIYMHRYNADTLARINGKYFLPESTRLKNDLDELVSRIESSTGRDRIRLEKERQKFAAAYNEVIEYGQVLDHMANQYIDIDLDDGVKVNYAKFQGVELVSDNGTKVKKDLLVPIK